MSKLPQAGTTIFTVMSALAQQHGAINLSQGFPDFPVSENLIESVAEAMRQGHNQYAPMAGLPLLRERLASKIQALYQTFPNPDTEMTITPGGTYALYTALTTLVQPGDEVIVLEPAYDSYVPNILTNGGVPVCVPLRYPDYSVDWDRVREAVSPRTKAIVINTPHNPSGYVWTPEDIAQLRDLIANTGLYIVSDEVYEHITFDGQLHESILKYPDLWAKALVIFSFGKVFHATGWKIGYCVAPATLTHEFRKIHQFLCFTTNTPMQHGLAAFLAQKQEYLQLPNFYQQKRDRFLELIRDLPFTVYSRSQGTYFQMLGYERISSLPDREFAVWLTEKYGVASIPVSAFIHDGRDERMVRFCFGKKEETLLAAAEKLQGLLQ